MITVWLSLLIGGVCLTFAYRVDDAGEAMILAAATAAAALNAIRIMWRRPR